MAHQSDGRGGRDVSKALFYLVSALFLAGAGFAAGLHAGARKTSLYRTVSKATTAVADSLALTAGEAGTLLGTHPAHFLQASRHPGDGVTVNSSAAKQSDLVLLAGFFHDTNELRLIERSGAVVARWPVRYYDIFKDTSHFPKGFAPATNWNIDIHGALALPDGSVVFNFEWGGLVKLDRCGHVVWTVRRQTHHSVERAERGGFWVLGRRGVEQGSPYPPFEPPFLEDTILRVSDEGAIVAEYSVVDLYYKNGLVGLLTATGAPIYRDMEWNRQITHTNKVEELTSDLARDFPMFQAGDLALSSRDRNLVMVVDSEVQHVKWWSIGPWLRQHDVEFRRGGTLMVFNNNIFPTAFEDRYADLKVPLSAPAVSNILEIDPRSMRTHVLYGSKPGQELLSVIKGKVDPTPAGGLIITEAQSGRVREVDANGTLIWEYVNRFDADEVAEIGEARLYPNGYFQVKDWSCP